MEFLSHPPTFIRHSNLLLFPLLQTASLKIFLILHLHLSVYLLYSACPHSLLRAMNRAITELGILVVNLGHYVLWTWRMLRRIMASENSLTKSCTLFQQVALNDNKFEEVVHVCRENCNFLLLNLNIKKINEKEKFSINLTSSDYIFHSTSTLLVFKIVAVSVRTDKERNKGKTWPLFPIVSPTSV